MTNARMVIRHRAPHDPVRWLVVRFWLSRETSVSIREQLSAQLLLGILSRRLAPGERLPSVRDLARRLHIHANTVSAVYQDLAARGWVAQKHGSGVFVSANSFPEPAGGVEAFARGCLEEGLSRGFTRETLLAAFADIRMDGAIRQFLVIDPDLEFARIVAAEISEALDWPVPFRAFQEPACAIPADTCVLLNSAHASRIVASLDHAPFRCIELRSMQDVVEGQQRPAESVLIGVVSRSASILEWSSTLLSALGFSPDAVLLRNPREPHWKEGLGACGIVASDIVTAGELPEKIRPVIFRIVSERFLTELRGLQQHAVTVA